MNAGFSVTLLSMFLHRFCKRCRSFGMTVALIKTHFPDSDTTVFKHCFFNLFDVIVSNRSGGTTSIKLVFDDYTAFIEWFMTLKHLCSWSCVRLDSIYIQFRANSFLNFFIFFFLMLKVTRQTYRLVKKQLLNTHQLIYGDQTLHESQKKKLYQTKNWLGLHSQFKLPSLSKFEYIIFHRFLEHGIQTVIACI